MYAQLKQHSTLFLAALVVLVLLLVAYVALPAWQKRYPRKCAVTKDCHRHQVCGPQGHCVTALKH